MDAGRGVGWVGRVWCAGIYISPNEEAKKGESSGRSGECGQKRENMQHLAKHNHQAHLSSKASVVVEWPVVCVVWG